MAAHVRIRRIAGVDDPAHRVRAFYPGRLGPALAAIVANRTALVAADHDLVRVRRVYRKRVQVAAHESPLGRTGLLVAWVRGEHDGAQRCRHDQERYEPR